MKTFNTVQPVTPARRAGVNRHGSSRPLGTAVGVTRRARAVRAVAVRCLRVAVEEAVPQDHDSVRQDEGGHQAVPHSLQDQWKGWGIRDGSGRRKLRARQLVEYECPRADLSPSRRLCPFLQCKSTHTGTCVRLEHALVRQASPCSCLHRCVSPPQNATTYQLFQSHPVPTRPSHPPGPFPRCPAAAHRQGTPLSAPCRC